MLSYAALTIGTTTENYTSETKAMLSLFVYQQPAVSHLCFSCCLQACQSLSYGHSHVAIASCPYGCMACMLILHACTDAAIHSSPIVCYRTIEHPMVITTCSVQFASLKAKARLTFGFAYLAIACCLFLAHICAYMVLASNDRFLDCSVHKHPTQHVLAA